ncbi:MAG: RNA polymerase subunit sigma-70 [Acidobacteria bacterium]|jgi:RNA polymerase sigma-70 factor, ECF subfamily|nr:MAG: RNA polymerase subunit sigma-70 [Acidobacteriota bacterium]
MLALPMTLNTTAETETAKIARGLRERDTELLADLVERCQHRLVRYLVYLTGRREHAEDLAQETWIRVLQRGSQYNGRQRFDPWLFAIARNLAIDDIRKKLKAVQTASLPNDGDAMLLLPSSGPSPFEAAARSEDAMRLAGRLQILPPLYREALLLRFQEELSLAEIAQVVGAPVTTVTSRIYRGLAALRSAFEESDSHGV